MNHDEPNNLFLWNWKLKWTSNNLQTQCSALRILSINTWHGYRKKNRNKPDFWWLVDVYHIRLTWFNRDPTGHEIFARWDAHRGELWPRISRSSLQRRPASLCVLQRQLAASGGDDMGWPSHAGGETWPFFSCSRDDIRRSLSTGDLGCAARPNHWMALWIEKCSAHTTDTSHRPNRWRSGHCMTSCFRRFVKPWKMWWQWSLQSWKTDAACSLGWILFAMIGRTCWKSIKYHACAMTILVFKPGLSAWRWSFYAWWSLEASKPTAGCGSERAAPAGCT